MARHYLTKVYFRQMKNARISMTFHNPRIA